MNDVEELEVLFKGCRSVAKCIFLLTRSKIVRIENLLHSPIKSDHFVCTGIYNMQTYIHAYKFTVCLCLSRYEIGEHVDPKTYTKGLRYDYFTIDWITQVPLRRGIAMRIYEKQTRKPPRKSQPTPVLFHTEYHSWTGHNWFPKNGKKYSNLSLITSFLWFITSRHHLSKAF